MSLVARRPRAQLRAGGCRPLLKARATLSVPPISAISESLEEARRAPIVSTVKSGRECGADRGADDARSCERRRAIGAARRSRPLGASAMAQHGAAAKAHLAMPGSLSVRPERHQAEQNKAACIIGAACRRNRRRRRGLAMPISVTAESKGASGVEHRRPGVKSSRHHCGRRLP